MKYSELTLDMFRMLQVLEREPSEEPNLYDTSPAVGRNPGMDPSANSDRLARRENPHKYLLYKPTFGQIYNFLAHGLKELPQGRRLNFSSYLSFRSDLDEIWWRSAI